MTTSLAIVTVAALVVGAELSKRGSRSMALFHGASSVRLTIGHEGQCFVDEYDVATRYGSTVCGVSLDLDQLVLEYCDGYDPHENEAPADRVEFRSEAAGRGVDVLVYDDADELGQEHTCYRLVSARAVKMARETGVQISDEDDAWHFRSST